MAMEKEKLLAYFMEHYISRQEVLYKLPLNISIDAFWPELLKRRKANATLLPLNDASGMPLWYVQTERMVRASEKLCEEAMAQEDDFDPYRAPMTSAMTEEMFFTSFVEGAQISLQEAMDFLQRGTEPETIQEQMIWNNRNAWSGMMGMLYCPMDEQFIKALAWMLTEEMDNAAQDYRQMDTHPIAAMNSEPYTVPPAHCLPDRMRELCDFLCSAGVHPLIKASVGQAFILVMRPFPEGNERLARMVSSAVLLRSGYGFFRDISISGMIAKENYRYYKSMCEILRSENGGDLTYFIEYYLELLVRALEAKKERERRRELEKNEQRSAEHDEMLEQEKNLALIPLAAAQTDDAETNNDDDVASGEDSEESIVKVSPAESPPLCSKAEYIQKVQFFADTCKRGGVAQRMRVLLGFMERGIRQFSATDYKNETGEANRASYKACLDFLRKGLVTRDTVNGTFRYTLAYHDEDDDDDAGEDMHVSDSDDGAGRRIPLLPRAMAYIERLYEHGTDCFTSAMLKEELDITSKQACDICRLLIKKGCVEIIRTMRPMHYRYTGAPPVRAESVKETEVQTPQEVPSEQYDALLMRLDKMSGECATDRDKRIACFLRKKLDEKQTVFYRDEFVKSVPFSRSVITGDLRYAANLGLIERSPQRMEGTCYYEYHICATLKPEINTKGLTEGQIVHLTNIFRCFGENDFTIGLLAEKTNTNPSTIGFHMANLHERGLLHMERRGGNPSIYHLMVTPESHPECFTQSNDETKRSSDAETSGMTRSEYAATVSSPQRSIAAAGAQRYQPIA